MKFESEEQKQFNTGNLILRFLIKLKESEKLSDSTLQARRVLLEGYWKTFSIRHSELTGDKNYDSSNYNQQDFYFNVEEAYLEAQTLFYEYQQNSTPTLSQNESSQIQTTPGRLPKISLPTFSGDYLAWENFRDFFIALVHEAPGLSNATRLQYLKTSLTGDAAKIISGVTVTDANYQGAWNALVDRYDNKRILLSHYFNRLLALPSMTTETASELKSLLDSTAETRRALENLGRPVQHWDDWFVHLTTQKLESNLRKDWETSIGNRTHLPTFDELSKFLSNRIATLDTVASVDPLTNKTSNSNNKRFKIRSHSTNTPLSAYQNCALCKKVHFINQCPDFKQKAVPQRWKLISQLKLCANCLRAHPTASCKSIHRCYHCKANHHTMLHENSSNSTISPTQTISTSHAQTRITHPTLLATALVKVSNQSGQSATIRALLDQGSEVTFISENLTQRLRLPRTKTLIPVTGMSSSLCGTVKSLVQVQLSHPQDKQSLLIPTQAYVLPRLTKVDLVIGADLYGHILLDGLIKGPLNAPVAQNIIFGWVLSGRLDQTNDQTKTEALDSFHCAVDTSLANELCKFWEIEEVQQHSTPTPEEHECEEHFKRTHTRSADGRFIVRLPQRSNVTLGKSYSAALRSLHRSESRRQHDEDLDQAYRTFMKEYIDLGHMSLVPPTPNSDRVHLPHHAVWKTDGQSKKIRVVFNASARTSSGHTLNDSLLPGPKLQQELSHVLLRWRKHAVVFTADIVKMFRQIWVHPEDRSLQHILWRDSPDQEIQEFQLNTLASEEAQRFPEAANVVKTQTYVDDILAGAETLEDAHRLKEELQQLLMAGGFQLAKWASNSSELAEIGQDSHFLPDGSVKTLGLQWNPSSDTFGFKVALDDCSQPTKRTILSATAKLFDPLGWLAPVLVKAKMFLQDIWTIGSDWDDALLSSLETAWTQYYHSLLQLQEVQIPRLIYLRANCTWEIHGFCDASNRAYAAAVYLRIQHSDGTIHSNLLTAKTKVAPLQVISLPRLELCGAVLLAKLLRRTTELFPGTSQVYAWTDSQVVLCWLRSHPSRWKCFVANRTSEIHQTIPNAIWNHSALFVCMATKAIHLEAVTDCTTAGFLAAFKRFFARRGIPAVLYSDQGTNFRGANACLRTQLQKAFQESPQLAELLANDRTEWKFNPPYSPHFGGIWEAGVRSVKFHLRRVIGNHTLTYEELSTLLAEIEACLNLRPILPISSSPEDFAALTPGHFLIGTAIKTIPEPSLLDVSENHLSRWQLLRRLYEEFWRRWSSESNSFNSVLNGGRQVPLSKSTTLSSSRTINYPQLNGVWVASLKSTLDLMASLEWSPSRPPQQRPNDPSSSSVIFPCNNTFYFVGDEAGGMFRNDSKNTRT